MKKILIIGIGAGDPDFITVQAINALNTVDVFFVLEKGAAKDAMVELRRELCRRHARDRAWPAGVDSVVVMLDGEDTYRRFVGEDIDIYWGAYLGTADEILIAGRLGAVADEIHRVRTAERQAKGWIMDTYLLRRR